MKTKKIISWLFRITAAIIMLQTLYFKFTAQPESVYIFTTVGLEPWGRIGIGIAELIAAMLLIIPRTIIFGAGMSIGLMSGAIFFHLTKLGFEVMDDGGQLFGYAVIVLILSISLLIVHAEQITTLKNRFLKRKNYEVKS